MNNKKVCFVGAQGVGKTQICEKILTKIWCSKEYYSNLDIDEYKHFGGNANIINDTELIQDIANIAFIPEQFREVVKDVPNFTKRTEEITLATYAKQLYLENLYTAQERNILCDRSVLDTFVYYDYFDQELTVQSKNYIPIFPYTRISAINYTKARYSKIYLIEPSDRPIENNGFRMTDKKQQLEIHKLFLEYLKDFNNVEIINQEDAFKEEFINKVVSEINDSN